MYGGIYYAVIRCNVLKRQEPGARSHELRVASFYLLYKKVLFAHLTDIFPSSQTV